MEERSRKQNQTKKRIKELYNKNQNLEARRTCQNNK